jgi:hypothetical protein
MAMIQWIIDNNGDMTPPTWPTPTRPPQWLDGEPTWSPSPPGWSRSVRTAPGKYLRGLDLGRPVRRPGRRRTAPPGSSTPSWSRPARSTSPSIPTTNNGGGRRALRRRQCKRLRVKSVLQIIYEASKARTFEEWCRDRRRADLGPGRRFPRSSPATARRPWPTCTAACPSTPAGSTTSCLVHGQRPDRQHRLAGWAVQGHLAQLHGRTVRASPSTCHQAVRRGIKAWGVNIIRHSAVYDKTTLFEGFPGQTHLVPLRHGHLPGGHPQHRRPVPLPDQGPAPVHGLAGLFPALRAHAHRDPRDTEKAAAVHRLGHHRWRNEHVRGLHLPGHHLPGALGVPRRAPLGVPQGIPHPPAGGRPPCGERHGIRRRDAHEHGVHDPGLRREVGTPRPWGERLRPGRAHEARRRPLPAHGGQRGVR